MRLAERLRRLELARPKGHGFRRVVLLGPDDPSPPDGPDVHIIRIAAYRPDGTAAMVLPHNGREDISALPRVVSA